MNWSIQRAGIMAVLGSLIVTERALPRVNAGTTTPPPQAPIYSSTTRVSVSSFGEEANAGSGRPSLSWDGRYVVFGSGATNLDPLGRHGTFVHDRFTGVTRCVTVGLNGDPSNSITSCGVISANGRYVAFFAYATNLVAGGTNGHAHIFVHDQETGQTELVSVSSSGEQGNKDCQWEEPAMSPDGRYVAFASGATNLVPGDTNHAYDVFVRDRLLRTTTRASLSHTGEQIRDPSRMPAISADGRFVAFVSAARDIVPNDRNRLQDIFIRDLLLGTTARASLSSSGADANAPSYRCAISPDGVLIAFTSAASNLVAGDTNGVADVFLRNLATGMTTRVSLSALGVQGNAASSVDNPVFLSDDGRYVGFCSNASNLVPDDANNVTDVFVRDVILGTTTRVSVDSAGVEGNGSSGRSNEYVSSNAAMSADGLTVAFHSVASNLVANDTNGHGDVFVRQ